MRKTITVRMTTVILTLMLVLSVIPIMGNDGVQADAPITTPITIDGNTAGGTIDTGVTWDKANKKLTLTDVKMDITDANAIKFSNIDLATVELVGNNEITITNNSDSYTFYGINSSNGLVFQGSGALMIDTVGDKKVCGIFTGGKLDIYGGAFNIDVTKVQGIKCYQSLTVNNAKLNIKSSKNGIECSYGIIANNSNIDIKTSASGIECSNNSIKTNNSNLKIESENWGLSFEDIEINGGTVDCYGKDTSLYPRGSVPNVKVNLIKGSFITKTDEYLTDGESGAPVFTLPAKYKYRTASDAQYTEYNGSNPYKYDWAQKYVEVVSIDGDDAPVVGTKFTSSKLNYKITDAKTNGNGTVAVTGFAKGKATKSVTIGKTVKYKGYTYKVTSIAKNAFKGNKKITTIKIGNNIKTIGDKAFYKATKLKKVTIGTGLTKIGKHVFCHDSKLKTMTIKSKKLKSVGKHSFVKMKNLKVKAPKSKVKAYKKLFKNKGQKKNTLKVVKL